MRKQAAEQEVKALRKQASRARQAQRINIAPAQSGNTSPSEAALELDTCCAGHQGGECVSQGALQQSWAVVMLRGQQAQ
jgi:hypothetical protein